MDPLLTIIWRVTSRSFSIIRASIVSPSTVASALLNPMRLLWPPAKITPVISDTPVILGTAITSELIPSILLVFHMPFWDYQNHPDRKRWRQRYSTFL